MSMQDETVTALARVRSITQSGMAKVIRESARLSLREVADSIGTHPSTVWRWEQRERTPRGELAIRYEQLLRQLLSEASSSGRT